MAMNGTTLGDTIASIITDASASSEAQAQVKALWEQIGVAIISHIQSNAVVTVASGIAVTTSGSATAQTGVTTATGIGTIA